VAALETLTKGARVRGIVPDTAVTVVDASWFGNTAIQLTYRVEETGAVAQRLLYRGDESTLMVAEEGTAWAFDGDGSRYRLILEAYRIRLAFLFDPLLAMSASQVEALPHQIAAVYENMLGRQPLRFLLADDPGAGKTIMAGLYIKELALRGDLERCLIVAPANLAEQWQDELLTKFNLHFHIVNRAEIEAAAGNPFDERDLIIGRIDLLKQDENMECLTQTEWDLVVVDEAHKMSATYDTSGDKRETARYKLGRLLGEKTRHLLLLTATPHRGKELDFQLFLDLLDGDRFEGRPRGGSTQHDASDLMRRLLKEELVDFEGKPLFPERRAYTVNYDLSDDETALYTGVTRYVSEEMSRAETAAQGEGGEGAKRRAVVGFALTTLQRRLASSPNAIYRSLARRRARLETALNEARLQKRQADLLAVGTVDTLAGRDLGVSLKGDGDVAELQDDLDDRPEQEVNELVDAASAARTVAELEHEIAELGRLERMARRLHDSGTDSKWRELNSLLQDNAEMFGERGERLKLVIFTEHRDTLDYLQTKIVRLLGNPEAVAVIHGALSREERRTQQELFVNDPAVRILIATDAAGEGINLQRAHLMVNYDLPWNPNRLEQRFGRIHRFGQREVCHCWNIVAHTTREGAVFRTLLEKLETEREALGGKVFDVLGQLFEGESLRDLLLQAIRYGDDPMVKARLQQKIADVAGREHFDAILREQALNAEQFGLARLRGVKDLVQRAQINRLVPYFIGSFFKEAFESLGGTVYQREEGRFEITHVPAEVRRRDRQIGRGAPVLKRYERICFDKNLIHLDGRPDAQFIAPGHPLLDTVISLVRERHTPLLRRGAVLVDNRDEGCEGSAAGGVRALFCVRHDIADGRMVANGERQVVSSELHFIEIDGTGAAHGAVQAPYLDYRPLRPEEQAAASTICDEWAGRFDEKGALTYSIECLVPPHLEGVRAYREELTLKTMAAVKDRLTKEIAYWDHRAEELKEQELAGKRPKINSGNARQKADDLAARLKARMAALALERQIAPQPPVVVAGALVVPARLLAPYHDREDGEAGALDRAREEALAMAAVMAAEERMGYEWRDVHEQNRGYDIESRDPATDRPRLIEVKGRRLGKETVTVSRNECMAGLNTRGDYILAVALVEDDRVCELHYIPDTIAPALTAQIDFGLVSVDLGLNKLLSLATAVALPTRGG